MSWNNVAAIAVLINLCATFVNTEASTRTGYILIDANSDKQLAAQSENTAFMPASTMKLVTMLSALDLLGPDHRFETSLSVTGKISGTVLEGDLILQGNGDVELDLNDLMRMGLALRHLGVRQVSGRFAVSDNAFLRVDETNADQPLDAPYNAGIGPLSLAFGRVTLHSQDNGSLYTNPEMIERGPAWRIASDAKRKRAHDIPVRDVGMHTAFSLRRIASELGIDLPKPGRGTAQAQMRTIARIKSKTLVDMIEGTMVYSNNQLAETIGLATANTLKPGSQSLAESAGIVWKDLVRRLPETDWRRFTITNHSGLDPNARATPVQLAALLEYGLARHHLPSLLPANAWSGSLSRRLVEKGRLQRIWAKTGSIDFAAALAGYLLPETGGLWLFVILSDDPERRIVYDAMPEPSAEIRKESRRWDRKIKAQHDVMLRRWISGGF